MGSNNKREQTWHWFGPADSEALAISDTWARLVMVGTLNKNESI